MNKISYSKADQTFILFYTFCLADQQRGHFGTLLSVEGIWVFALFYFDSPFFLAKAISLFFPRKLLFLAVRRSVTFKKGWYRKKGGICRPQHSKQRPKQTTLIIREGIFRLYRPHSTRVHSFIKVNFCEGGVNHFTV